jgi:hypothetical protein
VPVAEILPDLRSERGERLADTVERLKAELPLKQRIDVRLFIS